MSLLGKKYYYSLFALSALSAIFVNLPAEARITESQDTLQPSIEIHWENLPSTEIVPLLSQPKPSSQIISKPLTSTPAKPQAAQPVKTEQAKPVYKPIFQKEPVSQAKAPVPAFLKEEAKEKPKTEKAALPQPASPEKKVPAPLPVAIKPLPQVTEKKEEPQAVMPAKPVPAEPKEPVAVKPASPITKDAQPKVADVPAAKEMKKEEMPKPAAIETQVPAPTSAPAPIAAPVAKSAASAPLPAQPKPAENTIEPKAAKVPAPLPPLAEEPKQPEPAKSEAPAKDNKLLGWLPFTQKGEEKKTTENKVEDLPRDTTALPLEPEAKEGGAPVPPVKVTSSPAVPAAPAPVTAATAPVKITPPSMNMPSPEQKPALPPLPDPESFKLPAPTEKQEMQTNDSLPSTLPTAPSSKKVEDKPQAMPAVPAAQPAPAEQHASLPTNPTSVATPRPLKTPEGVALVQVNFSRDQVELDPKETSKLVGLVNDLRANKDKRIRIVSYASGTSDQPSAARRISLQRAITVRKYIVDSGIDPMRINVQAMGEVAKKNNKDQVEVFPIEAAVN